MRSTGRNTPSSPARTHPWRNIGVDTVARPQTAANWILIAPVDTESQSRYVPARIATMFGNGTAGRIGDRFMSAVTRARHRIGAHTSAAGGVHRAAEEAAALGCNTLQVFTRSPRMWQGRAPSPESVDHLAELRREHDLNPVAVHGCYLTNLAAADPLVLEKSKRSFRLEIDNARLIGADYLVIHPGSARGQSIEQATEGLASALAEVQRDFDWGTLRLLLENTAGGGATLGRDFAELASIKQAVEARCDAPLGYCIDTAHCFAAGYDVSTAEGLHDTVRAMHEALGMEQVRLMHTNDSKTALGSNSDRHESIGEGRIGSEAFVRILRHPDLRAKPMILETPFIDGSHAENVRRLWALADEAAADRTE